MCPDSRAEFRHGPVTTGLGTRSRQLVDGAAVPCACLGPLVGFVRLLGTVFELVLSAARGERAEVGSPSPPYSAPLLVLALSEAEAGPRCSPVGHVAPGLPGEEAQGSEGGGVSCRRLPRVVSSSRVGQPVWLH